MSDQDSNIMQKEANAIAYNKSNDINKALDFAQQSNLYVGQFNTTSKSNVVIQYAYTFNINKLQRTTKIASKRNIKDTSK